MKRIIFHYPSKIDLSRPSASQMRPIKLLDAFCSLGYQVDFIKGNGRERKISIKEIKKNIENGIKYDFIYSESSTMPTLLTESSHLPLYPCLDFDFFKYCKSKRIKIGLFYRDIYWCFDSSYSVKKNIAKHFYRYDLKKYSKLLDVLFLPSIEMSKYIPIKSNVKFMALPPGVDIIKQERQALNNNELNILYVGGLGVDYNLDLIMRVVSRLKNVKLIVCCRRDEWELEKLRCAEFVNENIEIVHKSGKDLLDLYKNADLFNLFVEPTRYREFAVPFKLFESIGNSCPVLASNGTWVSNYIVNEGLGFVCDYNEISLEKLLLNIQNNKSQLELIRNKIRQVANLNKWTDRVLFINDNLGY
jgi:glycosyltransferase involved in cell wall biosynthesis